MRDRGALPQPSEEDQEGRRGEADLAGEHAGPHHAAGRRLPAVPRAGAPLVRAGLRRATSRCRAPNGDVECPRRCRGSSCCSASSAARRGGCCRARPASRTASTQAQRAILADVDAGKITKEQLFAGAEESDEGARSASLAAHAPAARADRRAAADTASPEDERRCRRELDRGKAAGETQRRREKIFSGSLASLVITENCFAHDRSRLHFRDSLFVQHRIFSGVSSVRPEPFRRFEIPPTPSLPTPGQSLQPIRDAALREGLPPAFRMQRADAHYVEQPRRRSARGGRAARRGSLIDVSDAPADALPGPSSNRSSGNGVLEPLVVQRNNGTYKTITGQKRFLPPRELPGYARFRASCITCPTSARRRFAICRKPAGHCRWISSSGIGGGRAGRRLVWHRDGRDAARRSRA